MRKKIFALGDILLGTFLHILIFLLAFWSEIESGNRIQMFFWLLLSLLVFAIFFDNIIVIKNDMISFKYFNPFKKNVSINFNEIEKVKIRTEGYRSTLVIITVYRKDGTSQKLLNLSASYLDELHDYLTKNHLLVERVGTS